MSTGVRVLVLEASLNSSLAVIRSLGKAGFHVTVGDHYRISPGLLSRYARNKIRYPNPEENCTDFLHFLEQHIKEERYDLIFPISDFTVLPIAKNREKFERYAKLAMAPTEQLLVAQDKAETIRVAEASGVNCPKTIRLEDIEELEQIAQSLKFPVVVKARSKVSWAGDKPYVSKVTKRNFVSTPEQLKSVYYDIHKNGPRPDP